MENNRFKEMLGDGFKFLTNRIIILLALFAAAFYLLVLRFFDLQIVNGDKYIPAERQTITKTIPLDAPRGTIYDRFGRPLAINEITRALKIDTSVKPKNAAEVYTNFVRLMEKNGETIADDFPMTAEPPWEFTLSEARANWWKRNMDVPEELNAAEAFAYLRGGELFNLPEDMPDAEARKVLPLLSAAYMERFNMNPVTAALNVGDRTIAFLEENNQDFPGIYADVGYLRHYPGGESVSHILGYIRKIDEDELETYRNLGYTVDSLIGKDGMEKAFELQLAGTKGSVTAEIDSSGRRVGTVSSEAPVPGDRLFMTIDLDLQEKCGEILRETLKQVLTNKLMGVSNRERPYTDRELLISMIEAGTVSTEALMASEEGSESYKIRSYAETYGNIPEDTKDYIRDARAFITECVDAKKISAGMVILAMYEQGIITLTDEELSRLGKNAENTLNLLVRKINEDEISPAMTNLDPCTGSVVVTNIRDGSVLAAVGYPVYDNNEFVNNFNGEYFQKLNNDPARPLINRPFAEPRATGSTFKMITALAGLENGVITPAAKIFDKGVFTDAGVPYANCRVSTGEGGYHGSIDVRDALKVSCNYFFYETAFRLGNSKTGTKLEGIARLNEMMEGFGLNDRAGVEIFEVYDSPSSYPAGVDKMSSPSYKEFLYLNSPSQAEWVDGDTIRTAIGQAFGNSTAATMAKYFATLASGGARYQLHLLDQIRSDGGELLTKFGSNLEYQIDLRPENLEAVYEGMRRVASAPGGTAYAAFNAFPIPIAAKTGTAQQGREFDHTSFGCFAPFDEPQIAVYVMIPFGDTKTMTAPASVAAKEILTYYFGLDSEPWLSGTDNALAE